MATLVRKLAEVMGAVGWIEKKGTNEFHKYKYAQESDLVDALRGELAKRHVMVFPDVQQVVRSPHETETMKWDDKLKTKIPVLRKTQLTEIVVKWTFVDGESGEERSIVVHGVGEDNVDKGFYKAFTGSEKYMLMKTFLIPTGDDPEKDSKEDAEEARQQGKEAAKQVGEAKVANMRQNAPQPPAKATPDAGLADAIDALGGLLVSAKQKQTKQGKPYVEIELVDFFGSPYKVSSFENFPLSDGKLHDILLKSPLDVPIDLIVQVKTLNGKDYRNLVDIKRLGDQYWDDKEGVRQVQ